MRRTPLTANGTLMTVALTLVLATLTLASARAQAIVAGPYGQIRLPALSPDTGMLAFEAESPSREPTQIYLSATSGSAATRSIGPGLGPSWSPDSKQLA